MFDFMSIGEILIDFAPFGATEDRTFQQNPGGAPANVACVLSKLGCNTSFIGKVGEDLFGQACQQALESVGVCTDYLIHDTEHPTTLAFVCLDVSGNREFSFYRDNTADVNLNDADFKLFQHEKATYFHFGSVALTAEPSKSTVLKAVRHAKQNGAVITYDPNLRLPLWPNAETAKQTILETLALADILKISEEEAQFLFGIEDCGTACRYIFDTYHIPFIIITRGPKGCVAMIGEKLYPSYAYDLKTVDTTGAGDSFLAGVLYHMITKNKELSHMSDAEINEMFDFANAVGSLVTTKKGAIPAIPSPEEIADCIANAPKLILE